MSPVGIALFSAVRWWAWDYREFLGSDSDSGLAVVVFPRWLRIGEQTGENKRCE